MRFPSLAIGVGILVSAIGAATAQTPPPAPVPAPTAKPPEDATAIMNRACVACHDLSVLTQTPHTAEDWPMLLQRMVSNGALVSDAELKTVQDYLVANYSSSH